MSQSDKTKEKLLESACAVFNEKGYQKAKVSDIVSLSGVAQGTFYIYFKSKKDCFNELWNCSTKEFLDELNSEYEEITSESIYNIIETIKESIDNHKLMLTVFHFEQEYLDDYIVDRHIEIVEKVENILIEALEKSGSTNRIAKIKSRLIGSVFDRYLLNNIYVLNERIRFEGFDRELINYIMKEV
jgi:AcrR family transcriptional regulator